MLEDCVQYVTEDLKDMENLKLMIKRKRENISNDEFSLISL
jgi:hypothetical protein